MKWAGKYDTTARKKAKTGKMYIEAVLDANLRLTPQFSKQTPSITMALPLMAM